MLEKDNNMNTTDTCNLVKKTDYNAEINEIEQKILMIMILINILLLKNFR